ncbi:hypothetical protein BGX26_000552 [Mortierella sp. AD094]|nr:hypothetical protein BGX26_000552 [Mortierella sp. AD094]
MSLYTTQPLLLPELLLYISHYVERKDMLKCNLVCKTWYASFNPVVWETFVIDSRNGSPPISVLDIEARAHHIRKLVFRGDTLPRYLSIRCSRLDILIIQAKDWHSDAVDSLWSSAAAVIRESPTLTTIQLSSNEGSLSTEVWDAIGDSPNVKALKVESITIGGSQSNAFWRACTTLKSLDLNACIISPESMEVPNSVLKLQEIKLANLTGIRPSMQLDLLTFCPELRSLYWRGKPFPMKYFAPNYLPETALSNIDSLDVRGGNIMPEEIAYFINRVQKSIKKLALVDSQVDGTNIRALEPHFHALQELDFTHSRCSYDWTMDWRSYRRYGE